MQLTVRLEARQDTTRVVVVEELASHFKVQFVAKPTDPFPDTLRLYLDIQVVRKS